MMSTAKTTLAAATVTLVLAGCGSSHGNNTTQSTPHVSPQAARTKAEFIKRGDAICRHANAILIPLRTKVVDAGSVTPAQQAEYARVSRNARSQLRKLHEPSADRSAIRKIFVAGEKVQSDGVKALKEVSLGNAEASTQAEDQLDRDGATYRRLAHAVGLKYCGNVGSG